MAEKYKTHDGFVKVPVLRGFNEIGSVFLACCRAKFATGKSAFICGGYVRYMASTRENPHSAGDVDIYCEDNQIFECLREYFKGYLEESFENLMCLTYKVEPTFSKVPVQLIKPVREGAIVSDGSMEDVLSNFDFTVVRAGLINESAALVDADFIHDDTNNLIRIKKIHCPITSTLRCMKYAKKGYYMRPSECIKLFADWQNRSDEYKDKIVYSLNTMEEGEELTQADINELEKLLRID